MLHLPARRKSKHRVGLYADRDAIRVALLDCSEKPVRLVCLERVSSEADLFALLKRHGFHRGVAHAVLAPDNYEVFLIERPDVPEKELRQALRWRLSDQMPASMENPVLDWFDPAGQKGGDRQGHVHVVAAKREAISRSLDLVRQVGLKPLSIGVFQLALRNLMSLAARPGVGYAFLMVGQSNTQMIVGRDRSYYFSREMEGGLKSINAELDSDSDEPPNAFLDLSLEIQRSLDYYDSYFKGVPLRDLWVACSSTEVRLRLVDHFSSQLDLTVQPFDHTTGLHGVEVDSETSESGSPGPARLAALGAALRDIGAQAAPAVEAEPSGEEEAKAEGAG